MPRLVETGHIGYSIRLVKFMDYIRIGKRFPQGFTLIELLIVIVLIGILSVVLLGIIDPDAQISRAKDGVTISSINKLVLSTNSFISSYSNAPDEKEFFAYIQVRGRELFGTECSYNFSPDYECLFTLRGIDMPTTCDLSHWTGSDVDVNACSIRYQARIMNDPSRYRIYVKAYGFPSRVLAYDNKEGGRLFDCPYTIADFESLVGNCKLR